MEKWTFNKSSLLVFFLAFVVMGCTHSPTSPDLSDSEIIDKAHGNSLAPKADFINPPPVNFLKKDLATTNLATTRDNKLIWQHIENKLALTDLYNHPRVIQQKNKFLNQDQYLSIVTKRAEPFIYYVLSEIDSRQMPAELAILPIVESGYYPRARSHAKAEGLWQIMPYTAKDLGLKRTAGYDGRHDIHASTSAALDYLSQMYNMFDGDWLLALAAYNSGPQRVKRALKKVSANKNGTYSKDIYWDLRLPRETLEYVPKILALCSIINDKEISYKLLHPIEDKPYLSAIQLSKRISPAKLIQTTAVNETEIKLLNPAIQNLNTPVPPGYNLLVPERDAEFLALAINNMEEAPKPNWTKHTISRGESLSGIARRYSTTVNALRESNNMQNNNIFAGRTLIIPLQIATHSQNQNNNNQSKYSKTKRATATLDDSIDIIDAPYVYVVAMGDSFWKIANRNNTTVKRLFEINGRNAGLPLQPGETILID